MSSQKGAPNESVVELLNSDKPIIEKMFCFIPDYRPGYGESKRERKIAENLFDKFYQKRLKIIKSILESDYKDPREILVGALVVNKFAPRTLEPWVDWVLFLSGREGGWDVFIQNLQKDYNAVTYMIDKIKYHTAIPIVFYIVSTFAAGHLLDNETVRLATWLLIIAVCSGYFMFPKSNPWKHYAEYHPKYIGNNKVDKKGLIPARSIRMFLGK